MYLSENLADGKLDVTIKPATVPDVRRGTYAERSDPNTSWLTLEAGADTIHLRLTWEQLDALHAVLDALLHDHTRYTLGHGEPVEVLPDRDPTAPVIDPPSHRAANVLTINGNEVAFTATDDWRLCVHTVNGEPMSNRDLPDWDTYADAVAYLESVLEHRPATVKP